MLNSRKNKEINLHSNYTKNKLKSCNYIHSHKFHLRWYTVSGFSLKCSPLIGKSTKVSPLVTGAYLYEGDVVEKCTANLFMPTTL